MCVHAEARDTGWFSLRLFSVCVCVCAHVVHMGVYMCKYKCTGMHVHVCACGGQK